MMLSQKMFAQEQYIRDILGRLRTAVRSEEDRYQAYVRQHPNPSKTVEHWRERILVYTETSNLLVDYLTDYTVNQHGVLKYLRQAEAERDVAKTTLLYMDQLHEKQTRREAALLAREFAYSLIGKHVELLEPELTTCWSEALEEELALYQKMVQERREAYA